jgi:predicted ATP-grasp superfamily ATP-dependent carboligase
MTPKPSALLIGIESVRIAVPVARSLHRHGIEVDFATIGPAEKIVRSRAVRTTHRLPDSVLDQAAFSRSLLELVALERYGSILPLSDRALVAVGPIDRALRDLGVLMCPEPYIVDRVLDKTKTVELCLACGVRVPESYTAMDLAELDAMRRDLRFPLIAKGRSRHHLVGFKVDYFDAFEDLRGKAAADPAFLPNVLLQEYVRGDGLLFAVLMHRGTALSVFQHRRLKELPASGGVGVLLESEAPDPAITSQALAVLRAIEWEGLCCVEFRHDRATGDLWLLEVNGRHWGSLTTALACGLDFPLYQWQLAHGILPDIPSTYKAGVRVRWTAGDVTRLRGIWKTSGATGLNSHSKGRETLRFFTDFNPWTHAATWSASDPLPALQELWYAVRGPRRRKLE